MFSPLAARREQDVRGLVSADAQGIVTSATGKNVPVEALDEFAQQEPLVGSCVLAPRLGAERDLDLVLRPEHVRGQ